MRYHMHNGSIELNGKWQDHSAHVLVAQGLAVADVNVVITQEMFAQGSEFSDFAEKSRREIKENIPSHKMLTDVEGDIDGKPAHFFELTWIDKGKPLHQMQTQIHQGNAVIVITATAPNGMDTATRNTLLEVMRSYRAANTPLV